MAAAPALAGLASLAPAQRVSADTAVACSSAALVSAINAANASSGGTLVLQHGCNMKLTAPDNATDGGNGLPVITASLSIVGNGATITRSSSQAFRIFDVASGANVSLSALTLSNGLLPTTDTNGGAAIDNHGTLTVTTTTFQNNVAPSQQGASGGAIQNSGVLTVTLSTFTANSAMEGGAMFNQNLATVRTSTFTNNKATLYGGGALVNAVGTTYVSTSTFTGNTAPGGGAIDNDATMTVRNSTFYNNKGGSTGGGGIVNFGSMTLTQSTLFANSAPYGANVYTCCGGGMSLRMTIVAHAAGGGSNCGGTAVTDSGYNLDDALSCGFLSSSGSISGVDPSLDALRNNGGPTQTMALHADSPAVDAIPTSFKPCKGSQDQRGVSRPQAAGCDIGAYELVGGRVIDCSAAALISAVNAANAGGVGSFGLPHGCIIKLTAADNTTDGGNGLPVIFRSLTIAGNGATITRSSSQPFRFFEVAQGASLTLSGLILSNGLLPTTDTIGGGAIANYGTVTVTAATFQNNATPAQQGASGGAIQNSGLLSVTGSTFSGNSGIEGGGIFNQNQATIATSTFTNNKATLYGGGGLVNAAGTTSVIGSTFVGNTGPGGGAIDNDATLSVSNTTIFNNTAGSTGGGGIVNFGSATVTQSTLFGNSSPYGADVYNCCGATMTLSMSILARAAGGGANCGGTAVGDAGYNLDDATGCGFLSSGGSISGVDPKLAALDNNGGATQTMALHSDSPAVDAIPSNVPGCSGSEDQRGVSRPQGAGCDIGAYELITA
jgi:hypothetical protein